MEFFLVSWVFGGWPLGHNFANQTAKHIYFFFLNPIYNKFEIMPPAISTTNNTDVIVVENNTSTPATRRDSTSSTIEIDAAQDMKTMTITPTSKDVTSEKNYWNTFYSKFDLQHPSQFCVTTAIGCRPFSTYYRVWLRQWTWFNVLCNTWIQGVWMWFIKGGHWEECREVERSWKHHIWGCRVSTELYLISPCVCV